MPALSGDSEILLRNWLLQPVPAHCDLHGACQFRTALGPRAEHGPNTLSGREIELPQVLWTRPRAGGCVSPEKRTAARLGGHLAAHQGLASVTPAGHARTGT